MTGRATLVLCLLLCAPSAARAEGDATPAPAAAEKPADGAPAKTDAAGKDAPLVWHDDAAKALADAAAAGRRVLAVVTEDFVPSEPCDRLAATAADAASRETLSRFTLLRVVEGKDTPFSAARDLQDLGHPYTALLAADGSVLATLRGAWSPTAWTERLRRLDAAADRRDAAAAKVDAAPKDPAALWELSESLRALGRAADADDVLSRGEPLLGERDAGLRARYAFRRAEARYEDRVAVQDFEGAGVVLDAYERDFPNAPHRRRVALYRALVRAHTGDLDAAIEDMDALAAAVTDDADLRAEIRERLDAARRVKDLRK